MRMGIESNLDDSMELDVVVIASTSQLYEVPTSPRSVLVVHLFLKKNY